MHTLHFTQRVGQAKFWVTGDNKPQIATIKLHVTTVYPLPTSFHEV